MKLLKNATHDDLMQLFREIGYFDSRQIDMVIMRARGFTFEEIGKRYKMSRQNTFNTIKKIIDTISV